LTRIVSSRDAICQSIGRPAWAHATEVYPTAENKAFLQKVPRTKVTGGFGEADANIRTAAMFAETSKTELNEGKIRDAETKGFLTNRAADRGGDHPDHRSYRYSELASRPHGG
jgi:hypothetical protein